MRTPLRATVGGVTAALLLAIVPTTASAATTTVTTAAELQSALDLAASTPRPARIHVEGTIDLDTAATYDGDGPLTLTGPGALAGRDPDQDVLVLSTDARVVRIHDLTVTGGRRGITLVVPQDAIGRVRLDLHDVTVQDTGYHGVQVIDGLVDLDQSGGGTGLAVPDASLPSEALVESEVVGGADTSLIVVAERLAVHHSGRAALDQDGLRVDERGHGGLVARFDDSSFEGNGADGVELDEAGPGSVRSRVRRTTVVDNGDFDVSVDPDDGIDVDEAGPGSLLMAVRHSVITGNVDQGLDLDEEDAGGVRINLSDSDLGHNVGENLKVTELGSGWLTSRVGRTALDGSADDGVQLEEFDAGSVTGRVSDSSLTGNGSQGLDVVSLDISEEEYEALDDADQPLPTDGAVGRLGVCRSTFADNGDGPEDDIHSFGVRVRCGADVPPFPPAPPAPQAGYTLTVLHVNDGESDLLPDEGGAGSISRFGELLQDTRRHAERGDDAGVVAITAGDNFLAGPELQASFDKGGTFYDMIALDHLDFDAFTIGNHEFDFGPEVLADFIGGMRACNDPFVSANLDFRDEPSLQALVDAGCIQSSTVTVRDGRRIGIIGLTTPELREVSSPGDTIIGEDLAAVVNAEAQALTDQGIDIVLLASHQQDIDNEVALASQLSNVDAIIAGGGGEALDQALTAETADGFTVPVVTVPGDYFDLGQLTLDLTHDGEVVGFDWALVPVTGDLPQDGFLLENVELPVEQYLTTLAETVVTTSEVGLNGVRADVRTRETNVGNLLADSFVRVAQERGAEFGLALDGPIVGLQNGGGIRNDSIIGPGDVTALDTFDIAPFDNFVSVVEDVSPADLVALVEHGLSAVPDPEGFFGQWSGLVVEYDGSAPAGSRIVDLTVDGTPYVLGGALQGGLAPVDVATINFLAAGNDGFDEFEAYDFTLLGTSYQQALADQLALADLSASSVEYRERADVALRTRIIPAP